MNNPGREIKYLETVSHGTLYVLRPVIVITKAELSDTLRRYLPDLFRRKSIFQLAIGVAITFTLTLTTTTSVKPVIGIPGSDLKVAYWLITFGLVVYIVIEILVRVFGKKHKNIDDVMITIIGECIKMSDPSAVVAPQRAEVIVNH